MRFRSFSGKRNINTLVTVTVIVLTTTPLTFRRHICRIFVTQLNSTGKHGRRCQAPLYVRISIIETDYNRFKWNNLSLCGLFVSLITSLVALF